MIIKHIEKDSIAQQIGLQSGDKIESINNHQIQDIIDYRFYVCEELIDIKINRNTEILIFKIEKEVDEELGLSLEPINYRSCRNNCIFCFIDQNPPHLRSNLYFKDEDYRLSFLHGNYVTLTNITKSDLQRIVNQRLSPLYVSVHATDSKIRSLMLGLKKDDLLLEKIKYLADNHIELHAQVVLCPTINDEQYLDQTIADLANFFPCIKSIAIVPVGLTRYRQKLYSLVTVTPKYSDQIVKRCEPIAKQFKKKFDTFFIYLADEFYLSAEIEIPPAKRYDDFYQYENGVGMMRYFMDTFNTQSKKFVTRWNKPQKMIIVTAELAQSFFRQAVIPKLNTIEGLEVSLKVITNKFFGSSVGVTGLLTGSDIYNQLKELPRNDLIILPGNCLNNDGLFLDDWTVDLLEKKLNQPIKVMGLDFTDLFVKPSNL